jgi:sec-independent protein translocase protein TatA
MVNVAPLEVVVVLVIALMVLGPKRLPDLARSVGRGMREFKEAVTADSRDEDDSADERALERP